MPNHVTNRITADLAVIELLLGCDDKGEPRVDFNKIIPMPEIISKESAPAYIELVAQIALGLISFKPPKAHPAEEAINAVLARLETSNAYGIRQMTGGRMPKDFGDKEFSLFIKYLQAWKATGGHMNWYSWSIKHWGTKWNAYSFERIDDKTIQFETAWSAPHPVIEELAARCNGSGITHEWADEDTGNNVGRRVYRESEIVSEEELTNTKEGYELAFKLTEAGEYYRLSEDGSTYEYHEEEE